MRPELHLDPSRLDLSRIVADKEAIRRINPQRFEFEQIDAIVWIDPAQHIVAGYKNVRADEFWTRGHIPGYPLMPGVLICEAAAQICSYYIGIAKIMAGDFMGFGGMENIRFRKPVCPDARLVLVGKATKINRRQTTFNVQGFVDHDLVFHGDIIAVPLPREGQK